MWFYFFPHCIYHLTKWFPQNNRIKFRVVVFLLSAALLVPEFIVLSLPTTSRACDQPLLNILVAGIVFLFMSVGFAIIFSLMDPVPRIVKILFHLFGVGSLILGLMSAFYTFEAPACSDSTTELYYWCYVTSVLALITTGYFLLTVPFWLANKTKPNLVLDWRRRSGICYEPVVYCSCVWHV
ncbi:uncharacterized protein LOC143446858 [Clavelina lepadiformis]|uniref:uncharacterized protein LOC143446858 n=1 Tax=Clavelina lepadiformis TaxID=159417 RepID=UPI0040421F1E